MNGFDFRAYLDCERKKVDKYIEDLIAGWEIEEGQEIRLLNEAMAYSLTAGVNESVRYLQ